MGVGEFKSIEVINASAGTGKTYTLTARVYEEIEHGLAPEQLLVTTFTNKAAAELRERIRLKLLSAGNGSAAQRIYDGLIGTVNGVCARLLIENALDAGLSPSLNILPEEDADQLFRVAVRHEIEKHADSVEQAARRMQLGGGVAGPLSDWGSKVKRIVELARANMIGAQDLRLCGERSWESMHQLFGPPTKEPLDEMLIDELDHCIAVYEDLQQLTQKSQDALKAMREVRRRAGNLAWSDWLRLNRLESSRETRGFLDELQEISGRVCSHEQFQKDVKLVIDTVFNCAADSLASFENFKTRQGLMDFIDQEVQVLRLARESEHFREHLRSRVGKVLVDEFQDTSPIQLALFLELHTIVSGSIWVGDPKQSIYGFRGTDAELMNSVAKLAHEGKTLSESWRSRELLVRFSNAVFSAAFSEIGKEKVCLSIPESRAKEAGEGWIEAWHLLSSSISGDLGSIAAGIVDLMKRRPELRPGDIAVLCRRNDDVRALSSALAGLGVRASASQGPLADSRECRAALAGLRYLESPENSVALAELIRIFGQGSNAWLEELIAAPSETVESWRGLPSIMRIDELRTRLFDLTPLDALQEVIDRLGLIQIVARWENSQKRLANLTALKDACEAYVDRCAAWRRPATLVGFLSYVDEMEPPQAEGDSDDAVHVLTYHKSKGLEWPIVIMTSLDTDFGARTYEPGIVAARQFDPRRPLADRSILYWPWPFGNQRNFDALDAKVRETELWQAADRRELMEAKRLLYVGMTRARDGLVFAIRKKARARDVTLGTKWLDKLCSPEGEPVLDWGIEPGEESLRAGGEDFPCLTIEYRSGTASAVSPDRKEIAHFIPLIESEERGFPPARVSPSSVVYASGDNIVIEEAETLGGEILVKGEPDLPALGSAVHGFLGAEPEAIAGSELDAAEWLLKRWEVTGALSGQEMAEIRRRFDGFLASRYPNGRVMREWPISLKNEVNQLAQGWIDTLVEIPAGYVIVDHKTYPGAELEAKCRQFAPQLAIYREAVAQATSKAVLETLIHFPVAGKIFRVIDGNPVSWETGGKGLAPGEEEW